MAGKRRTSAEVLRDQLNGTLTGGMNGMASGLREVDLRGAARVATPDQVASWRSSIAGLVDALSRADRILEGIEPATCERCGNEFVPRRAGARYCSGACRQAAHRVRANG